MMRVHYTSALVAALMLVLFAARLHAAPVTGIYADSVPVADGSAASMRAAFSTALARVLVKATGRADAGRNAALLERFGDPTALVQQYRRDGTGNLWVQFDPAAVGRGLDAAGLPVWGDDRPVTVVWLAFDAGEGEREVLAAGGADGATAAALRRELLQAAQERAVPVVLPLRDSQDLAAVSYADVWGDFSEPVVRGSARYQADAVLIGRARLFPQGMPDVRWTLLAGGERAEWRGDVANGPQGLADRLAQRLTTAITAGPTRMRLVVSGVENFEDYGRVLAHLADLDVVESLAVARVDGQAVDFELGLRGGTDRLVDALALRRVLEPAIDPAVDAAALHYRLAAAR
jgi:hypothetical protein